MRLYHIEATKIVRYLRGLFVAFVCLWLAAVPVLAAYSATITVAETSGNTYTMLPMRVGMDTTYMVAQGYITATGLDTRVVVAGSAVPHMLTNDKLFFASSVAANSSTSDTFTTGNTALSNYYIISGYNGYVTTTDHADLEIGASGNYTTRGYVNTSAAMIGQNLVNKQYAIKTYVSALDTITAQVGDSGTINTRVTASTDDTFVYANPGWNINNTYTGQTAGWFSAAFAREGGGMRFQTPGIPVGATITAAYLTLTCGQAGAVNNVNTVISGDDEDDAATFTDYANYTARPRTAATVNWNAIGAWVLDTEYNSPDISAVIQEIIDRPGYTATSDVAVFWDDHADLSTHAAGCERFAYSYDNVPAKAPLLHVEWNMGAAPVSVSAASGGSGIHTVNTYVAGGNLGIQIDTGAAVTAACGAVPATASNYVWGSNATPYFEYITLNQGATPRIHYHPETYISTTVLPNITTPGSYLGAFTWGSNPAGVTLTAAGLLPPVSSTTTSVENPSQPIAPVIDTGPVTPDDSTMTGVTNPFYPVARLLVDINGLPIQFAWGMIVLISVLVAILGTAALQIQLGVKNIHFLACGLSGSLVMGYWIASQVFPLWGIFIIIMLLLSGVVMERTGGF